MMDQDQDCTIIDIRSSQQSSLQGCRENVNSISESSDDGLIVIDEDDKDCTIIEDISQDNTTKGLNKKKSYQNVTSSVAKRNVNRQNNVPINNEKETQNNACETLIVLDEDSDQEDPKRTNIPKNNKQYSNSDILNFDEIYKKDKVVTELLEKCLEIENSSVMVRIINRSLIPIYNDTTEEFKKSDAFQRILTKTFRRIETDPVRKFSHLKEFCETMKQHTPVHENTVKKRAQLTTLKRGLNGTTSTRKFTSPVRSKKTKPDVIDLADDDDDDDVICLNNNVNEAPTTAVDKEIVTTRYITLTPLVPNKSPVITTETQTNQPVVTDPSERIKKIQYLEEQIRISKELIDKLECQEVNWDDDRGSAYLSSENLKASVVSLYKQLCDLVGAESVKRHKVRLKAVEGSHKGPVRCLEKFINDNIDEDGNPPFPDIVDVIRCVRLAKEEYQLPWDSKRIQLEARALFVYYGRNVQKQRQKREWRHLMRYVKGEVVDPADNDPALQATLQTNAELASSNEKKLLDMYAQREYNSFHSFPAAVSGLEQSESDQDSDSENTTPKEYTTTVLNNNTAINSHILVNSETVNVNKSVNTDKVSKNTENGETTNHGQTLLDKDLVLNNMTTALSKEAEPNNEGVLNKEITYNNDKQNMNKENSSDTPTDNVIVFNSTDVTLQEVVITPEVVTLPINYDIVDENLKPVLASPQKHSETNKIENEVLQNTSNNKEDTELYTVESVELKNGISLENSDLLHNRVESTNNNMRNTELHAVLNTLDNTENEKLKVDKMNSKPDSVMLFKQEKLDMKAEELASVLTNPTASAVANVTTNVVPTNMNNENSEGVNCEKTDTTQFIQHNEISTNSEVGYISNNVTDNSIIINNISSSPEVHTTTDETVNSIENIRDSTCENEEKPCDVSCENKNNPEVVNDITREKVDGLVNHDKTCELLSDINRENTCELVSDVNKENTCELVSDVNKENTCGLVNNDGTCGVENAGSINPDINSVVIKQEKIDILPMLNDLGDNYTVTILSIEDPFEIIEISDSSDSEDEL